MENFEVLMGNLLALDVQAKHYSKIWNIITKDSSALRVLIDTAATEEDMIDLLSQYGPQAADEVLDGDFEAVCCRLLPLAYYEKRWYRLIGWIYGTGFDVIMDPLCGRKHPLVFAAEQHDLPLAVTYIDGQARFNYLSYDGEQLCEDGIYRTTLEQIVLADDEFVMMYCLRRGGACANAFGFRGDKLLDLSRSFRMRRVLRKFGAKRATREERNLVRAVNEIRHDCLQKDTVKALFRVNPLRKLFVGKNAVPKKLLLKLCWRNGTNDPREQKADLFWEAALACSPLLERLYPYVQKDLDDKQKRDILRAVLGQHGVLPLSRALDDCRYMDVAEALEALSRAGFRYGTSTDAAEYAVADMFHWAHGTFLLWDLTPIETQLRIFHALWAISGKNPAAIPVLRELAEERPILSLKRFLSQIKCAAEEE